MKRKVLLLAAFVISIGGIYAQGEMDAYKLSQSDLTGTARSVGMGGAMGALGGDISAISINPAGIGIFKSYEVVTTLNFQNTKTETELNAGKLDQSKFKVTFDNLAFVTVFPTNSDVAPSINFGFSYNRLKNFDRKYSMKGSNLNKPISEYMAHRANGITDPQTELLFEDDSDIYPLQNYDWLAVLGYNSWMIDELDGQPGKYGYLGGIKDNATNNYLSVREKGSISTYDFNVGTTFADVVSAGLTVSITDISYRLSSDYDEDYNGLSNANMTLMNDLETDGTGYQFSLGLIFKPIDALRIGLAYHSPTWYDMTDYASAGLRYDLRGIIPNLEGNNSTITTGVFRYDYRLRTPDRYTLSLAAILLDKGEGLFPKVSLSADYEYTNYKNNMKLFDDNGGRLSHDPNLDIKEDFKGSSTVRVGAEVRFTNQFSMRAGYSWKQSPLNKEFKNNEREVMTVGSVPHFTLDGDTHYYTYGLGYRFSPYVYADVAFVMRNQKADLYSYDHSEKATWKDNTFQGLLTLGFKFRTL
jgi:long-subunit fatty acid transport protein